jgi:uncharacterized protein (DUF58 family)
MFKKMQGALQNRLDRWLFRMPVAEPGEVFLHQRRVFIVPTRPGLAFGAVVLVLFIGSVNYTLSLGFALTFLIAGCAIVDMHLTFRNLAHLHLAAGRTQAVFAGDEARFELHLLNRRKHDRYAIWLGFIGKGLPALEQSTDVAGNAASRVVLATPAVERGWLLVPRIRIQTRFPLGLLRAWSYWQPDAKVLVYPHPEDNAPPLPMHSDEREEGEGQGGHDDFAGVRAYQEGDSMKHLAWRQIAKVDLEAGGTLVTKHFEGGATSQIALDYAKLPRGMNVEMKLSRLTRWVIEAESRGLAYTFQLGETSLAPALGPAHQEACLRAMALYQKT